MTLEQDFLIQNPKEERYNEVLSPFEEFLPGMRPSNSDDYLSRLVSAMTTGELRNFRAVMNGRHVHSKRAKAGMVYLVKKKPGLM